MVRDGFWLTWLVKVVVQTSPLATVIVAVLAPTFGVKISLVVVSSAPVSVAVMFVKDHPEVEFSVMV